MTNLREQIQRYMEQLESPDHDERAGAVEAIARSAPEDVSTPLLVRMLTDTEPIVWHAARTGLARQGEDIIPVMLDLLEGDGKKDLHISAFQVLKKVGEPAVPTLEDLLTSSSKEIRNLAALTLSGLGKTNVVEPLIEALDGPEPYADTKLYIWQLGEQGDARAVELITRELRSASKGVRMAAIVALEKLGDGSAAPALIESLQDDSFYLAECAATALGNLRAIEAVEPLLDIVNDADANPVLRQSAVEALGHIGDKRATETIIRELLKFDDRIWYPKHVTITDSAAKALGDLQDARAVPALIEALQEANFSAVRWYAAEALGKIGDERAIESLVSYRENSDRHGEFAVARVTLGEVASHALWQIETRRAS